MMNDNHEPPHSHSDGHVDGHFDDNFGDTSSNFGDTGGADNTTLGRLLRDEVPTASPGYLSRMDETIARLAQEREAGVIPIDRAQPSPATTSSGSDFEIVHTERGADRHTGMTTIQDTPGWQDSSEPRGLRWLNLGSAAALFAIVGLLVSAVLVFRLDAGGEVEVSSSPDAAAQTGDRSAASASSDEARPVANRDHWHAPYGVYSCAETAADGTEGAWLPKFDSTMDEVGIHSHQDGVIHLHPFFESASGENAQFHHFITAMGATLTDDTLELPDGQVLQNGDDCNGEPAQLHIRKWQFDFLRNDTEPEVITENLGATRFVNDREVWQLVHAPLDAEIGQIPSSRFTALDAYAGSLQLELPEGLEPGALELPADLAPGEVITALPTLEIIPDEVREVCPVDGSSPGGSPGDPYVVGAGKNSIFDTLDPVFVLPGGAHLGDAGVAWVKSGGVLGTIGRHGDAGRGLFYEPGAIIAAQPSLNGPIIQCEQIILVNFPAAPVAGGPRSIDLALGSGVNDRPWIEMDNEASLTSFVFSDTSAMCVDRYILELLGIHNSQPIPADITLARDGGASTTASMLVNDVGTTPSRTHTITYPADRLSEAYGRSTDVVSELCVPVTEPGIWTVTVELDPDNRIDEIDETNNAKSRTFEISGF